MEGRGGEATPRPLLLDPHRWTLLTRVLLLGTTFLTLLALGALSVLQAQRQVSEVEELLSARLLPSVEAVRQLSASLVDQETGLRGFTLARDEAFLAPYDRGRAEQAAATSLLREQLTVERASSERLDAVELAVGAWRRNTVEPELARARAGQRPDLALARTGKAQFDVVRDRLDDLQAGATGLVRASEQQRLDYQSSFTTRLLTLLGLLAVLGLSLVVLLYRWAVQPVVRLRQLLRDVAGGQSERPVVVDGPPEVREIAADAERMRVALVQQVHRAQRSREALEQQGPVVLALGALLATSEAELPPGFVAELTHVPAEAVLAGDVATVRTLPDGRVALRWCSTWPGTAHVPACWRCGCATR